MTVHDDPDEHRQDERSAPDESRGDVLHAGLDPEALFGGVSFLDEQQTVQWLGHLQRLASTGLLAGGMAHDLAGLMTPLLGECERALLDEDPRHHRESLVRMRELARRGTSYVRALLNLVRRDEQHRAAVPVESVVEDTLSLLGSTKRLAGVSVTRHLDNHHVALVDRARLMQAVLNITTNAVRAAAAGGREITVAVRGWRGWVLVEVEDNGPGVPPEIAERIYEPFVHAPTEGARETSAPRGLGRRTGLGLYITKRLVEEQGGRIEYETESGVGTIFRLMLEPAPVDERSEADAGGTRTPQGK
ncbi:MAG: HAMP domain-containing sensor histidine kinase [Planctomycetota bacterium]|nr:HAMP domain-containing sensor histidine kinase [Planctomycetota bacterium]